MLILESVEIAFSALIINVPKTNVSHMSAWIDCVGLRSLEIALSQKTKLTTLKDLFKGRAYND